MRDREAYLKSLAARVEEAWAHVERLFQSKKDADALRLLLDLSSIAEVDPVRFIQGVRGVDNAAPARQARRVGVPGLPRAPVQPKPVKVKTQAKEDPEWTAARGLCGLDVDTVRMARELGMTPRTLIKNKPSASQRWKAPVDEWVRSLHEKRFGRTGDPDHEF